MNKAIKTLEEIGQNASLKQHENLSELLSSLEITTDSLSDINKKEFICLLVPEDDEEE